MAHMEALPLEKPGPRVGRIHGHRLGAVGANLGIHYGATKFTLKYMARNEAIPAQNAIMGQRATNLMLVDSSQDGVDEAEA